MVILVGGIVSNPGAPINGDCGCGKAVKYGESGCPTELAAASCDFPLRGALSLANLSASASWPTCDAGSDTGLRLIEKEG